MLYEPLFRNPRPLMVLLLGALLLLPVAAPGAPQGPPSPHMVPNPGAELWRAVRQREAVQAQTGQTQVRGVESGVFINTAGDDWRHFRMGQLIPVGAWVLGGMAAVVLLFYLIRGRIKIEGGRSGRLVPRFSVNQRVAHWFLAILFLFLGLTGLVLLFGRFVLLPVIGPEAFAAIASASKEGHNLFGPIFPLAVLGVFALFLRGNGFGWKDVKWFLKAGGLFGKHMAPSGYYNAGEKTWYWVVIFGGLAISVSGYVLDFHIFGQSRQLMEWAHMVHAIAALGLIAASLGHIYIGSVGMEGAFESMSQGYVDANWAKEHHADWYDDMERAGMVIPESEANALEEIKRHDDMVARSERVSGQG
jgi:formate dehydrogenase subunit gamma